MDEPLNIYYHTINIYQPWYITCGMWMGSYSNGPLSLAMMVIPGADIIASALAYLEFPYVMGSNRCL